MARTVKITIDGKEYNGREEQFEIAKEEWNEYKLLDGGRVRLKTTVQKIVRVLDEKGEPSFGPDGDPWYLVRHNTQVVSSL